MLMKEETKDKVEKVGNVTDIEYRIVTLPIKHQLTCYLISKINVNLRLPELTKADIVIAGRKSFITEENFMMLFKPLALKLKAAIGAAHAFVKANYETIDYQIGSSRSIIALKLYIAFGISVSDHHIVGIERAKTIIAVNIDKNVPIISIADYILNKDMFDVISEMMKWLEEKGIKNVDLLIRDLVGQSKTKLNKNNRTKRWTTKVEVQSKTEGMTVEQTPSEQVKTESFKQVKTRNHQTRND